MRLHEYFDHHEHPSDMVMSDLEWEERQAAAAEEARHRLSNQAAALKADMRSCMAATDALRRKAHDLDDERLTAVEMLIQEALDELAPAWPERPRGGKDEELAVLRRDQIRLQEAVRTAQADLAAALAQGRDLMKQNHGLRQRLSEQTQKVEALRELASAQGLVKELS